MSRIVQIANFVAPHSGGIRTVLDHLARGYADAGHEVIQIVPGPRSSIEETPWGQRRIQHGVPLPGTGYRALVPATAIRTVNRCRPQRLEVHDRTTLTGLGTWASTAGVPAIMVAHERVDRVIEQWMTRWPGVAGWVAYMHNYGVARTFSHVVCTTEWAQAEFDPAEGASTRIVPLGVDAENFRPLTTVRRPGPIRLVMVSRLSPEKAPRLAFGALRELLGRGVEAELAVAGDGPLRGALEREAAGLPIRFSGHVPDRRHVATMLASADVAIAPGPVETFGLAALEALACGTPVVVNARSALPAVVGPAGVAAAPTPDAFAAAVQSLLAVPEPERRQEARRRALEFPWARTVDGFLDAHGLRYVVPAARAAGLTA